MLNMFDGILYSLRNHPSDWRQLERDKAVRDDQLEVHYDAFARAWVVSYQCTYREWQRDMVVPSRYKNKFDKAVATLGERMTMSDFMGVGR